MGDQDDAVLVPLHALQRRVTGSRKVNFLMVSMADSADSAPLKASLLQFLIEAVVLSALGGVISVVLAIGASYGGALLMGVPYAFDPTINVVALVFSTAIGMVFGYFPARRAAHMDPIEALRHE